MRLLFAISVASFCTVLWLALSLARRIRRDRTQRARPATQPVATEFFEAGEFRTPRALRLNQDVSQQDTRRQSDDIPAVSSRAVAQTRSVASAEAKIVDRALQFVMPDSARQADTMPHRDIAADSLLGQRKSPQPARSGSFRRVDLSHYNRESGDLTDPYTHSPRASGVRPVAKNI